MSRKQAGATERAIKEYKPGKNVYAIAAKHGIQPTTLYRALKLEGFTFKRGNGK
jgi:DNA-binding phage protein